MLFKMRLIFLLRSAACGFILTQSSDTRISIYASLWAAWYGRNKKVMENLHCDLGYANKVFEVRLPIVLS